MKGANLKSLVTLFHEFLADCGEFNSVDTSRDRETVTTRFENEGFEFFTLTLPNLASGLERALDQGRSTPDLFPGFRCRQNLPIFLGEFFELVFDRGSGALLDDPSIEAIRSLRQLSLLFKKIELPCSDAAISAAYKGFIKSNSEVHEWEADASPELFAEFNRVAYLLYSEVFSSVNAKVAAFELEPRHGPGSTAEKVLANNKYRFLDWTDRLEAVAPYWSYARFRGSYDLRYSEVDFRSPERELPVRVVTVPKTVKTPRIIALEPTCMQYMQQGVSVAIRDGIDQSYLVDLIGDKSQEPNQLLALAGSLTGDLATLDLSEASDRVSNLLVRGLFDPWPDLSDLVQATRSRHADVPENGLVAIHRFASMGSALCFPVETMVFLTIVLLGMQECLGTRFTHQSQIQALVGRVRCYGDDIIVPTAAVPYVVKYLQAYGLKVNNDKSFWTGKFRESCGKEYYSGHDVTVCRVRRELPRSRKAVDEVVSAVDLRNRAYKYGYWRAARWLDAFIERLIPFPAVAETSSVLGKHSFLGFDAERLCPRLHRPQVKGATVKYRYRKTIIGDDAALMKCLGFRREVALQDYDVRYQAADHLSSAGRPDASEINVRWFYSV